MESTNRWKHTLSSGNLKRSQKSLQESIQVVFMQYGVGIHIRVIDIIVLKDFIGITDIAICFRFWSWSERFSITSLFCCLFIYTCASFNSSASTDEFPPAILSRGRPHCRRTKLYTSYHRFWPAGKLHRASLIWDIAEVPYIFGRRHSPGISAHV